MADLFLKCTFNTFTMSSVTLNNKDLFFQPVCLSYGTFLAHIYNYPKTKTNIVFIYIHFLHSTNIQNIYHLFSKFK